MSFCATWVLFDSSGRSLRSQQRKRSLVSESFLRGRVGTFQLQGGLPPSAVRSRSHVQGIPLFWHQIVVAISFIQTSSLSKRQVWVQIVIIKVFILLQERPLVTYTHKLWVREEQSEREIRKAVSVCFYSGLSRPLSSPYHWESRFAYVLMVTEKGRQMPPWPPRL